MYRRPLFAAGRFCPGLRPRLALSVAGLLLLAACAGPQGDGSKQSASAGNRGVRTKLDGWGPNTPPAGFPRFVDHSVGQEEISMQAMGLVGVPYRWGGNTPSAGFDCSGLVRYVVERAANVDLPRTTMDMSHEGVSIKPDEVAPGDLIFFNTSGRAHSHVGVYVGNYRFVNAPSTGGTVRIDYVTNPYWAKRFDGIRRVASTHIEPLPAPLQDTPVTPAAPQPLLMPPRAYANNVSPPAGTDISEPPASKPAVNVVSRPEPLVRDSVRPDSAGAAGNAPDPIAATIARATSEQNSDDPIARIGARGY